MRRYFGGRPTTSPILAEPQDFLSTEATDTFCIPDRRPQCAIAQEATEKNDLELLTDLQSKHHQQGKNK
jgi:hypothetical protein